MSALLCNTDLGLLVFNTDTVWTWKNVKIALTSKGCIYKHVYVIVCEVSLSVEMKLVASK